MVGPPVPELPSRKIGMNPTHVELPFPTTQAKDKIYVERAREGRFGQKVAKPAVLDCRGNRGFAG